MVTKYKRVYAQQYGCWVSFSHDDFKEFAKRAIELMVDGNCWELPLEKKIKNRPACATWERGSRSPYSWKPNYAVITPLDWSTEDWESFYQEMA